MLILWLILVPLCAAALCLVLPSGRETRSTAVVERVRPWVLPAAALAHLGVLGVALGQPYPSAFSGWLVLDPLGKLVLGVVSVLFLVCAIYAPGYLGQRPERGNRVFCASLLLALGAMSLMAMSHHLGLMWVAMEATTLAFAPLLYWNRNPRSLEATWKYLLIGSVGVALALLGSFFLAYASLYGSGESTLLFEDLVGHAQQLSRPWLHAAFAVLFVGYGTKMGLAPMHTWKPDAYGEAPGLVGTLLAGGVTNCAFLAILRFYQICHAAQDAEFARRILVFIGLLSMAVAAIFMVRQRDFKRILAYSSVEHMGILVLGIGIGGAAVFGALLHVINNGLTKGVLFLSAGNIHRAYGSKLTGQVSGALRRVPISGTLLLAGLLAITGSPPFAPFLSLFTILSAALGSGQYLVGGLFLLLLAVVFIGLGGTVLAVVQGTPPAEQGPVRHRDRFLTAAPVAALMVLVTILGLYIPAPLTGLIDDASAELLGNAPVLEVRR